MASDRYREALAEIRDLDEPATELAAQAQRIARDALAQPEAPEPGEEKAGSTRPGVVPPPGTDDTGPPAATDPVARLSPQKLLELAALPDPYAGDGYVEGLRKVALAYVRLLAHPTAEKVMGENVEEK